MVFQWKDGLAVISLPTSDPLGSMELLKHVEGDVFRWVRSDEQPGHEVTFTRNESGLVTGYRYHSNPAARMKTE